MTEDAALLETVFHNVPAHARAPAIGADDLRWRMLSTSRTTRDLRMIVVERDLLRGLGLTREQLVVANGTRGYQVTARWAEYLYESIRDADGITWRSRHDDREIVFVLFDLDRVRNGDIVPTGAHLSLEIGEGRDKVIRLADSLGIDYPAP